MTAHKHAHLMALYAQDAMETDRPWEMWEARRDGFSQWVQHQGNPLWHEDCEYRRKPRTININGFEVPEPVRSVIGFGDEYWIPDVSFSDLVLEHCWRCGHQDYMWLKRGLVHLTREAAESHARALLSFTELIP